MAIKPFSSIPRNLVEWARFFRSTEVIPDAGSVGGGSIQDGAVTYQKIQNVSEDRLLGRDTSPAGQAQEIIVTGGLEFTGTGGIQRSALSGDVTAAAGSGTTAIAANAVSNGKFRQSVARSVIGRAGATDGNVADIAAGADDLFLVRRSGTLQFGALTAADLPNVTSGTYTPTLAAVTNIDTLTLYTCQYLRVGSIVTVSGRLDADATTGGVARVGISLPIASAFANAHECCGTAFTSEVAGQGAAIFADSTNDRAQMEWIAVDTADRPMFFVFQYQII